MSKKDRQLKKAVKQAKDENGIIKNDIFLNFKIDQKFHFNEHHKSFVDKGLADESHILFCDGPAGSAKNILCSVCGINTFKRKEDR